MSSLCSVKRQLCTITARVTIVKSPPSVSSVWEALRQHCGSQRTGAHFDLSAITYSSDDRTEDLFRRLLAFCDDDLLKFGSGFSHHGEAEKENYYMFPPVENVVVYMWLILLHPNLPELVGYRT